jgi:hypothetical protein
MKALGIILIVWGVIGIVIGSMMFGDIGLSCLYSAVGFILSGSAILKFATAPKP